MEMLPVMARSTYISIYSANFPSCDFQNTQYNFVDTIFIYIAN